MKIVTRLLGILVCLLCTANIWAQTNAALSGTVMDTNNAVVAGATVTIENINTGIQVKATTNAAGIYIFPSLQSGKYKLTSEKTGFKKTTYNDISLEIAAKVTLNISLEVGSINEASIQVSAADDTELSIGTSSVGGVISGKNVEELPLPGRDALGLVLTQGGLVGGNFSGARIGTLNVAIGGVNVMDQRINSGVNSSVFTSTDIIAEVKVITSPADAEYGRGSGQVLMIRNSGGNSYHGGVFNSHRNTVLNANDWFNNKDGLDRDNLIRNQFGGRFGGPIIKNKAFFFFNYEGQREVEKVNVNNTTYTADARRGIFRYYPGALNANTNALVPTVDLNGNPVKPSGATGDLVSLNLFVNGTPRSQADQTGIIKKYIDMMPLPNNFRRGDGLNTAGYTWSRRDTSDQDVISTRLDYHINDKHKINLDFQRDNFYAFNGFLTQPFPSSPGGTLESTTNFYELALVSTLSPTFINELSIGGQRGPIRFKAPWESVDVIALLPTSNGVSYIPVLAAGATPINNGNDPQGRNSPLYAYSDKVTLLRGRHEFKGGVEVRFGSSNGFNSFSVMPRSNIGTGNNAAITGLPLSSLGQNEPTANNILNDLTGSITRITQAFNATGGTNPVFLPGEFKQRTWKQREYAFFIRDNYKIRPNLTLHYGMRYEYYGVPFDANGRTAGLVGGSKGLYGISGTSDSDLFQPGKLNGSLTQVQLVGKNSPNPKVNLYEPDKNNVLPAIGFSWSIPWLGANKTVLRAGYSIGYERNALRLVDVVAGDQPGLRTTTNYDPQSYLNLSAVGLPLTPTGQPLAQVPLTDRTQTVRSFDSNLRTPYVQNWNGSIQKELPLKFTLEARYVGNKGTKLIRTVNINEANIFASAYGETILGAFLAVQQGGNSVLLDKIFNGLNLGNGIINGTSRRAGPGLRSNPSTRGFFANNNVGAFASYLSSTANHLPNPISKPAKPGDLLRNAGLPENWVLANPQFANAYLTANFANSTYHSFQLELKKRFSHGIDFTGNYTWSKALGEEEGAGQELQDSYRAIRNRGLDKRLLSFHTPHVWRSSGTFELPFGPGKKLLNTTNKFVSRVVQNWQFGMIYNHFSGSPLALSSGSSTLNQLTDNTPNPTGEFPRNVSIMKTNNGVVIFPTLKQTEDPSVKKITPDQGLKARSTLKAITDATGNILLVNPEPGNTGTMQQLYLQGPGSFRLDVNLIKNITIKENWKLQLRVDAIGLTNTPQFSTYADINTDINSASFGRVTSSTGNRIIVLGMRLNF